MPTHATKSGNYIPVSQLGSGTPTGSKYLKDDGTWTVPPGGGGGAWGGITGALSDQTDLQSALDAKSGTGHNHTSVYQPLATVLTNTTASFTTAQETKLSGIATGATANSSDATLLARANHTGTQTASTISDFNTAADARVAAASVNALSDVIVTTPSTGQVLKYNGTNWVNDTDATGGGGYTLVATLASNAATAANTTPINLTGLVWTYAANSIYFFRWIGRVSPAAATTGCGFQLDVSSAVTEIAMGFTHQLANTGTLSGGHSIADDASVGVSSGLPGTSTYPVIGNGMLRTGANTGTAQLRFRSETTAIITAQAGLTLVVEKVA